MALTAQEIIIESLAADTVAPDTLSDSGMHLAYGLSIDGPVHIVAPMGDTPAGETGLSWLFVALFAVFAAVCLRYRKNTRYFSLLLNDITEMRERHNAFDDTLRETSFVWLLNILWCGAAGILLYGLLYPPAAGILPGAADVGRMGVCIGMAAAYTLFLTLAYTVVGNVFSDGTKSSLWVKGYLSTQGLQAVMLFPIALFGLCMPSLMQPMIIAAFVVFILAKILFIYKGFCIFFSQTASWVLFLYYLCSLEIVPIVLTYVATSYLCVNV